MMKDKDFFESNLKSKTPASMDDRILNEKSRPITLTDEQNMVLDALKKKEIEEYPISQWYLGTLYALNNEYNPDRISQAAQSLRELIEKLPQIIYEKNIPTPINYQSMRDNISSSLKIDKKKYGDFHKWKGQEIDSHIPKTLNQIEEYLEISRQPSRREKIQKRITTLDPMHESLDIHIQKEKSKQIIKLWEKLQGFAHHKINPDIKAFNKCLDKFEKIIIDLLAPITANDQQQIQSILKLDPSKRTTDDEQLMLSLIRRRGSNSVFFFKHATDASWFPILKKEKFLKGQFIDNSFWHPMQYLENIAAEAPQEVTGIIKELPETDHPGIYHGIINIALKLPIKYSIKLQSKIHESLECLDITKRLVVYNYLKVLGRRKSNTSCFGIAEKTA